MVLQMQLDVIGIGYPLMDCMLSIPRLPVSNRSVELFDQSWQGGGMVSTAVVTASVLGASAGIYGVAGDDLLGQLCKQDFEYNGVDTSHLILDKGKTTMLSFVLSEKEVKARSFIARSCTHRELTVQELDESYISSARYLLVTHMDEATIAACRIAKKHNIKVMVDADTYEEHTAQNLDLIDIFIGSEEYYDGMPKQYPYPQTCKIIADAGPEIVVFTLGGQGCAGYSYGKYIELPAYNIDFVDSCGAGDAFHGAYLYSLLQGWDLEYSMQFSSATAAICCTRLGGRAGIATADVVKAFIETGAIDYSKIDLREEWYRNVL